MNLRPPVLLLLFVLVAPAFAGTAFEVVGRIDIEDVDEASGLARSQRDPGLLWVLNDDGKARVYAIDESGKRRGHLSIDGVRNRDWEDMSSFTLDGKPYLLIGDVGDNARRRESVFLYVIEEPNLDEDDKVREKPAWEIELEFPDGPRDVESIAVDPEREEILLLSKRDLPPALYSVPLRPSKKFVEATRLGEIRSLPPPRKIDIIAAPRTKNWFWQPTAIDTHRDTAIVLTYRALYVYDREPGQSWFDALNQRATATISLGRIRNAESAVIADDGASVFVTIEKFLPPLLKAPLPETRPPGDDERE